MLGILENVVVSAVLQWLFSGVATLAKGTWAFSWQHPILAGYVFFTLFVLTFLAYGTLRRMWEDGSFAALHISHKVLLLVFLIVPFVFGYLFDIIVMRCGYGWIRFGYKPWQENWKMFSASWTFSRLIWVLKDVNAEAWWWHRMLHAIDPKGH